MWKVSLGIRESIDLVRMGRGGVRRRVHMGRRGGDLTETASCTSVLDEGLHAWLRSLATGSQEVQGGPTQAVEGDEYWVLNIEWLRASASRGESDPL